MPAAAVVIGYALWFLLATILRLPEVPPWPAGIAIFSNRSSDSPSFGSASASGRPSTSSMVKKN